MLLFYFLAIFQWVLGYHQPAILADEKTIQAQLPNGLTYYIRENSYPKQRASLRLVVKVGSIYENEEEKGLAHFLEHLVFRETKHFKESEIFLYLESIGASQGADANAFTSFESTTYLLDIPLTKENSLETSLTILSDLATNALLSDEAIEKERNVVLDEWNQTCSSPFYKLQNTIVDAFLSQSPYANHFPIGQKEIIEKTSAETVRNFYKKWYRPDRMALIAVGDFDRLEVQKQIEAAFSGPPYAEEKVGEPSLEVTYPKEARALIYRDPELQQTSINLISFFPFEMGAILTEKEIRKDLLFHIASSLFQSRLLKQEQAESNFFGPTANLGASFLSPSIGQFSAGVCLFENKIEEGIRSFSREMQQILEGNITPSEWESLRSQLKAAYESHLANLDKSEHRAFAAQCIDHFLLKKPLVSIEPLLRERERLIDSMTLEEINTFLTSLPPKESFSLFLITPSQKVAEMGNEQQWLELFQEKLPALDPPLETPAPSFAIQPLFEVGKIVETAEDVKAQVLYWTLSNNIKVSLKNTALEHDLVHILAFARGGTASLSEEDLPSACLAPAYAIYSGLGGLTFDALNECLKSKGVSWQINWNSDTRSLAITAPKNQIETAFQFIHALFTNPSFDLKTWENLLVKEKEIVKQQTNDPTFRFFQRVREINYQNHFYFQPLDFDQAQATKAQELFQTYFSNCPQEFGFTIVGDFNQEEVAHFSNTYLASLPKKDPPPSLPGISLELFPPKTLYEECKTGSHSYATTLITIPYNQEKIFQRFNHFYSLHTALKILKQRLTQALRTQLGSTYGVEVQALHPFPYDGGNSAIQISFTSQPEQSEQMVKQIWQEIGSLQENPPHQEEVETVKTLFTEDKKTDELSNLHWIQAIVWAEQTRRPLDEILAHEKHISALTPGIIQETAQMMFSSPHHSVIVHLPAP